MSRSPDGYQTTGILERDEIGPNIGSGAGWEEASMDGNVLFD
jgi:hypothetical protein